ncbi:MAG: hypothetical protein Q9225_003055 [Loekoesia sp. 1 TL-2023]
MTEPLDEGPQGPGRAPESEEANLQLAIHNYLEEHIAESIQANRSESEGSHTSEDLPPLETAASGALVASFLPLKSNSNLSIGDSEASVSASASASELPAAVDVHHEDSNVRRSSPDPGDELRVLTAQVRQQAAHALASGDHQNYLKATHLLDELQLWASRSDTEEQPHDDDPASSRPGKGGQSQHLGHQDLGDSPSANPFELADGTAKSASKRPSSHESDEEHPLDFPAGHESLNGEPSRTSQWRQSPVKRTNQPTRFSPRLIDRNRPSRSANAATSPITRDSTLHALLRFHRTSLGDIIVEIEPLGPAMSSIMSSQDTALAPSDSSGSIADMFRFIAEYDGVAQKRRRVMAPGPPRDITWRPVKTAENINEPRRRKGRNATANFLEKHDFSPFAPGANVVFLSQLIPKNFNDASRRDLLRIFWHDAPYVPLCVMEVNIPGRKLAIWEIGEGLLDAQVKPLRNFKHPFGPNGEGWPTNAAPCEEHPRALPVEIFELVGGYLPRDSIQNMRLVNREFERKISCLAFKSVVVPFKPKIYGATIVDVKGKGKQKETSPVDEPAWTEHGCFEGFYDPNKSHVIDGMRVFEQWGPEIRKFALTFEVDEDTLKGLPSKTKYEVQDSFWGTYEWPQEHYNRFEQAAKLEQKADETSAMAAAFSELKGIKELGLSILSGLGWQTGPDISDRVKLLKTKPAVFGSQANPFE